MSLGNDVVKWVHEPYLAETILKRIMPASLPIAVIGVILFAVPGSAAAQENQWSTLVDDGIGETAFKSLDLVQVAAASSVDLLELRLELVTAPQATDPEAYVTTFKEFS